MLYLLTILFPQLSTDEFGWTLDCVGRCSNTQVYSDRQRQKANQRKRRSCGTVRISRSNKRRTTDLISHYNCCLSDRWVQQGEESVAFRLASWKEQRADQADSNIAVSKDSKFMAFITTKSVTNRRKFAQQLHQAVNEFTCVHFLQEMYSIVKSMHSPCMRLELLQYILGLDSRYSIHLVRECIELAATCLSAKNNL